MPLGPDQIVISHDHVEEVFKEIDEHLSDGVYMRDHQQGVDGKELSCWHFVGGGELTPYEKRKIFDAYIKAGWFDVEVQNSSDTKEKSGLWSVRLYRNEGT